MLLGEGTDDRVIMLQQLMFQYVGIWISTRVLYTIVYTCVCVCVRVLVQNSTFTGPYDA